MGDDESSRVSEVVADPNAALPFDRLIRETDRNLVREVLATLTGRESAILDLRFGWMTADREPWRRLVSILV
jgi:DNA-directed RNA polymerase sigma subunit (sigma70/sigma32)